MSTLYREELPSTVLSPTIKHNKATGYSQRTTQNLQNLHTNSG